MLNNLKQIRIKRNLTLKQLSIKTGISITYLNDLENLYRINPSSEKIDKLCTVLDVSEKELKGN